jgi:hypothetical protein
MAATELISKSRPRSTNESLDPTRVFDTVDFDAATDVDPERTHLPNRHTDVVRIQTAREDDWKSGANLSGEPPIGTNSGPTRRFLRIAVDQDTQRG